jgi:hypothetical protein
MSFLNFAGNQGITFKSFTSTGGTTYNLDVPASTNSVMISAGGILQKPGVDYNCSSAGVITTTSAITSGVIVDTWVIHRPGSAPVIQDNSISNAKMQDDAIGIAELSATGTPSATTFLAGNNAWTAVSSDFVKINSSTASGASVDFTSSHFDNSTYSSYVFKFSNIKPGTDGQHLCCRTSADGGSNYDSSGYDRVVEERSSAGNEQQNGGDAQSEVRLTSDNNWGSAANESLSGTLNLYNPGASEYTHMNFTMAYQDDQAGTYWNSLHGSGQRTSAAAVTGIQFFPSSGTLSAGTITMYGIK